MIVLFIALICLLAYAMYTEGGNIMKELEN